MLEITHLGDCLQVLKEMKPNSLDSLVTDPPAGISFMGKDWDDDKGGRDSWVSWMSDVMRECYRVLKPGAHGLVWALPRTSHWTATALENAGFEIRDVVTHLFGTGFPKSLDISKAIDKAAKVELNHIAVERQGGGFKATPYRTSSIDAGQTLKHLPTTDSAKKWQGWGTALKPASEHWILIRKPLSEKTVAANVLKYGTGGINIDASRIACDIIRDDLARGRNRAVENAPQSGYETSERRSYIAPSGRFPANLVLSHNDDCDDECSEGCAVAMLDEQSGDLGKSAGGNSKNVGNKVYGKYASDLDRKPCGFGDTGGASRFFYCAKASKSDRGTDNKHPTVKSTKLMEYLIKLVTPQGGTVLDPFMGSGSTGVACKRLGFDFVGIEREPEYLEISNKRLK